MKILTMLIAGALTVGVAISSSTRWSEEELEVLASMHIGALEPMPADPSNIYADDPAAARLGHRLFFDERLSSNGQVSCGTCHLPALDFQDGKPLAQGVGTTDRRTMPIASTARSPWLFWDGRKDSQWSQALGPLESPVEHGGSRAQYAHLVRAHYAADYEAVFGPLPDLSGVPLRAGPVVDAEARIAWEALPASRREDVNRIFANLGKAIAAYERWLEHGPSPFDRYVEALVRTGEAPKGILSSDEVAGARLFIGKAGCVNCHNGPLFTDDYFHNTGVPAHPGSVLDLGRRIGAEQVLTDEFNCRSVYSDARPEDCRELEHIVVDSEEMVRAFKTPSLRNVAERAPYMHAGQIDSLEDVVRHYADAPEAPAGRSELHALRLSRRERDQLVAFLRTLSAPIAVPAELLRTPRRQSDEP